MVTVSTVVLTFSNLRNPHSNLPTDSRSVLPKTGFLDILVVFRLDFGQISFNLVQKAFATQQFALLRHLGSGMVDIYLAASAR